MSYLRGTGTVADPYVIHNVAAWKQFFTVDKSKSLYFEVVADINMGGEILIAANGFHGFLNGNGFTVSSFKSPSSNWFNTCSSSYTNKLESIKVIAEYTGGSYPLGFSDNYYKLAAVDVLLDIYIPSGLSFCYEPDGKGCSLSNVILNVRGAGRFASDTKVMTGGSSVYVVASSLGAVNASGFKKLIGANAFLAENYPTLSLSKWIIDGVSLPAPIPSGREDLTTGYAINGTTRVGNSRKSRNVTILSGAYMRPIWEGKSDDEGKFFAPLYDYYDAVIPLIFDDYGYPLKKDTNYVIGDVVHPSTPNGYRYICEQVGTTGAILPAEPWSVEVLLTAGTAKFRPYPVYEPKCLGPIYPGKVNLVTGEKV